MKRLTDRSPLHFANHSRRGLFKLAAGATAAAAAPWVWSQSKGGQLTVILNQGLLASLWIRELHPRFEAETGARLNVQQSVTSNMLAMLKTQAANPPDLMQFSEAGVFQARDADMLRQHQIKNIPNWKHMRPEFDMAAGYSAGMIDAMHTIFCNANAVKVPPTAWADLWDPKNSGRIALPPVTWNNGLRMVVSAAQVATGKPLAQAQYDYEAGIRHLARLKQNKVVIYNDGPQALQMLQSGQVPLVPFYMSHIAPLMAKGAPVVPATMLAEGKHGEIVGFNMPKNAKNIELAEIYINLSLEKSFQQKIDSELRARCAHADVPSSPETLRLIGDPANTTYADWAFLSKNRAKITDMWNEALG